MSNIGKIHEAQTELKHAASQLIDFAESLDHIGMTVFAKKLVDLAFEIRIATKNVSEASNKMLDDSVKQAQQGAFNMLNGVLAGAALKER